MKRFVAFAVLAAALFSLGTIGCDDPTIPDDEIKAAEPDRDAQRESMKKMIEDREKASGKPAGVKVDDLVK